MENVKNRSGMTHAARVRVMAALIIFLSLATVVLFALTMTFAFRPARMSNVSAMENLYQRNFYDLSDTMSGVEVKLDKLLVANGKRLQGELSDEIWRETGVATVYLSGLPIDHHAIESTNRLVSQLGDYIYVLSHQLNERDMTESERTTIEGMYLRAAAVNDTLKQFRSNMDAYRFTEHLDYDRITAGKDELGNAIGGANSETMPDLVYDGPFSDALVGLDYSGLDALPEFTQEQILVRAKTLFGDAEVTGKNDAVPACWQIKTPSGNVQMTVRGGLPLLYDADCSPAEPDLQSDDAIEKAEQWANDAYGKKFESIWFAAEGGTALVHLAPTENGIVYYSEQVKVKISLADGKVCGAEAAAYVANLVKHKDYAASVNAADALKAVNPKLNAELTRLAVVPRKNGTLTLAYEFRGALNGKTYLSYVDASNGEEIALMRVMETETGVLVQ